jgi:hypothetical protein
MPRKKTAAKPPDARGDDAALLEARAAADSHLLVLTVATLAPVVQTLMSYTAANARHYHDAVLESAAAHAADLASLARTVDNLLGPTLRRPGETAPRTPPADPPSVA